MNAQARLLDAAMSILELAATQKKVGDSYISMNYDSSYIRNLSQAVRDVINQQKEKDNG